MKIAIVGLASTGQQAPWDDPSWEIWGLNGGHRAHGLFTRPDGTLRADRWFQIHPPEACDASEREWLQLLDAGVYDVPTYVRAADLPFWSTTYPSAAARGRFVPFPAPPPAARWLANTFCLEIWFAGTLGATDIGLYGVECGGYGRELVVERPAVAYWMGIAAANGVQVHGVNATLYPYAPIYGLEYWAEARLAAEITALVLPKLPGVSDAVNLDTVAAVDAAEAHALQETRS